MGFLRLRKLQSLNLFDELGICSIIDKYLPEFPTKNEIMENINVNRKIDSTILEKHVVDLDDFKPISVFKTEDGFSILITDTSICNRDTYDKVIEKFFQNIPDDGWDFEKLNYHRMLGLETIDLYFNFTGIDFNIVTILIGLKIIYYMLNKGSDFSNYLSNDPFFNDKKIYISEKFVDLSDEFLFNLSNDLFLIDYYIDDYGDEINTESYLYLLVKKLLDQNIPGNIGNIKIIYQMLELE